MRKVLPNHSASASGSTIKDAVAAGLRDNNAIETLVTQICYRAADLSYLLKQKNGRLSGFLRTCVKSLIKRRAGRIETL